MTEELPNTCMVLPEAPLQNVDKVVVEDEPAQHEPSSATQQAQEAEEVVAATTEPKSTAFDKEERTEVPRSPITFKYSSLEQSKQIRRSDRQIKRPKFDDELVESSSLQTASRLTPRKRQSNESAGAPPKEGDQPTTTTTMYAGKKRIHKDSVESTPSSERCPGADSMDSGGKNGKHNAAQHVRSSKEGKEETKFEAPSLTADRERKEKLAGKFNRVARKQQKQLDSSSPTSALIAESFRRWTAEDDVGLIAATTHTCNLRIVHALMKFSKRFTLTEIEERWWLLLYDEEASRTSKKRIDSLSREKVRSIQARIPFSSGEEQIVKAVLSGIQQTGHVFDQLLEQNQQIFHHARTAKGLEEYWRELKYHGLLNDQRPNIAEDELIQMESHFEDIAEPIAGTLPLDVEERHLGRTIVSAERETQEWERVLVEAVTGISPSPRMEPDTVCTLRGRSVTFDIRKEKALIGRSTRRHRVDARNKYYVASYSVNLSLEGPSARISRKQALLKLYDNEELYIHNVGSQPIFVDGRSILKGEKARLHNHSIIEISLIRLHLTRNENHRKHLPAVTNQPAPILQAQSTSGRTQGAAHPLLSSVDGSNSIQQNERRAVDSHATAAAAEGMLGSNRGGALMLSPTSATRY